MKFYLTIILNLFLASSFGQVPISGIVKDEAGDFLPGANVYEKGTYNGTITDSTGNFILKISSNQSILVISYLGYKRKEITVSGTKPFEIVMAKDANQLDEVVITAGTFEAGEKSRAVVMNPIEIATTAGTNGDIFSAISTFPGAQIDGQSGQLIVRGGEASETNTYIDGMLVSSPYASSTPDLPARGRFAPFMFDGVMFSTGGYSAEYGQALSSVLELQTPGLFDEDMTSISLMNVGASASLTRRYSRNAFSGEINYSNTWPYFAMATHDLSWLNAPQSYSGNFYYRQKTGKAGMLKTDVILNESLSELDYSNVNDDYSVVGLRNSNQIVKSNYNTSLVEKWLIKTGIAYNSNSDKISLDNDKLNEDLESTHFKFSMNYFPNKNITLKAGSDVNYTGYQFNYYIDSIDYTLKLNSTDWLTAMYTEGDIRIYKKIALRVGLRGEYSFMTDQTNLAPRTSLGYKISDNSQMSFAAGYFYQQPDYAYTKYAHQLDYEKAGHLLLNYQYKKDGRILRTEVYYKKYDNLITYKTGVIKEYENLQNNGYGYARGIDVFWKDNVSIPNTYYWISYSWVDSKRYYQDFEEKATPGFVSPHNVSIVAKHWIQKITTQLSTTYSYQSGRAYDDPNDTEFMNCKTPAMHDLSASASYITSIFRQFTVVYFSVSNILGQEYIYTYNYSDLPDENGFYTSSPVGNYVQRTFILGLFITIK